MIKKDFKIWRITATVIMSLFCIGVLYIIWVLILKYSINHWYTNTESEISNIETTWCPDIPAGNRQVYKYLKEHPEDTEQVCSAYWYINQDIKRNFVVANDEWFPKEVSENKWFKFIMSGIYKRKTYMDSLTKRSRTFWIDPDLVLSALLPEQIRIACRWTRDSVKKAIISSTPTLFRSYDISLWIGGIKVTTANKIKKDAITFWNKDYVGDDIITADKLIKDDWFNAKYAVFLVSNILNRWMREDSDVKIDLSKNPWVIATLYNMWNPEDKPPHKDPQIGWALIRVGNRSYSYWGLGMAIYWYLKIFK